MTTRLTAGMLIRFTLDDGSTNLAIVAEAHEAGAEEFAEVERGNFTMILYDKDGGETSMRFANETECANNIEIVNESVWKVLSTVINV
jgi:hypothetical protein